MSIESLPPRATDSGRQDRDDHRGEAIAHGHCDHWDHSHDSGGAIDGVQAWAAVLRRDRSFDGRFVTGVLTTGIYCRPSCAARHPARSNVRFFANGEEARDGRQ